MRFCSNCGRTLEHGPPVRCDHCGVEHWRNAKPCAGAMVVREGRLLLLRRAIDPWRGTWDIPGGFCEAHEHPIETAAREVREETGLQVRVVGWLGMWLDVYDDTNSGGDDRTITLNCYYHAVPLDPDAVPQPDAVEATDFAWFDPGELPDQIAFANHAHAVLAAWRDAFFAGRTETPLPDRPA